MAYYNFNGTCREDDIACIRGDNPGLRFGDGLFETIKFKNRTLILAERHFDRLWSGLALMHFEIHPTFTRKELSAEIHKLIDVNNVADARVRVTVIRRGPESDNSNENRFHYLIHTYPLPDENGFPGSGLKLGVYTEARKAIDHFSNLKHNNFLPYRMGTLFCQRNGFDDALILNHENRVCDSTISNVFAVVEKKILTPPLSEGCIAGVMRAFIIEQLTQDGYDVQEAPLSVDLLMQADEVFLTNSIREMRWVASLGDKTFTNTATTSIYQMLSKTNPLVFC